MLKFKKTSLAGYAIRPRPADRMHGLISLFSPDSLILFMLKQKHAGVDGVQRVRPKQGIQARHGATPYFSMQSQAFK